MTPARGLLVAFCLVAAISLVPGTAAASCLALPGGVKSAHAFTGVVLSATAGGRRAVVRAEDGRTVEVRGGQTDPRVVSSVDRTYQVGGRYEFHPINATSPFEDNACTATRLLGPGAPAPPEGAPAGGNAATSAAAGTSFPGPLIALAVVALGTAVTVATGLKTRSMRRAARLAASRSAPTEQARPIG